MPQDSLLIRLAKDEDIDEIVRMRLQLQEYIEHCNNNLWKMSDKLIAEIPTEYRNNIRDENARLVVAIDTEFSKIVGVGLGKVQYHDIYIPDRSGRIDDIWVDEDYRRKGICNSIVKAIIEFFKEHNVTEVCLDYVKGNIDSEVIWTNLGFKVTLINAKADLNKVLEKL